MRTIREIIGNSEKVWFYISSPAVWEKFADMAAAEGFSFGDLPQDKWVFGNVVSVGRNGSMGHVPLFVWCMSFSADNADTTEKIDFEKYISGCADYTCTEPHFRMALK